MVAGTYWRLLCMPASVLTTLCETTLFKSSNVLEGQYTDHHLYLVDEEIEVQGNSSLTKISPSMNNKGTI
jgi:hypothetical protein